MMSFSVLLTAALLTFADTPAEKTPEADTVETGVIAATVAHEAELAPAEAVDDRKTEAAEPAPEKPVEEPRDE